MPNAPHTPYRLADGVIVSLGPLDTWLLDLKRDYEVRVDFRYTELLEQLCLGEPVDDEPELMQYLLDEKVLCEGEPDVDEVIRTRLRMLDEIQLQTYGERLNDRARRAYDALLDCHARRKRFFERVGQCPILPETALRRALLVGDADEVGVKNILCLGDDDLTSVALAHLGHRVTVYDIDDFLMTFLRNYAARNELPIEVLERDLRDPLDDVSQRYDVFLTDPMSNRDCLEIFLSRGFALLKPGGVAFTALYAPVGRAFCDIADAMGFTIERWYARHNRYYSKYLKLHNYESDWLMLRPRGDITLKPPADESSVPLNLYREDYHQRAKSLFLEIEDIEEERYAKPMFLHMLLDGFEKLSGLHLGERHCHYENDWTVIHCAGAEGYLTLHVDRPRRRINVNLHPFEPGVGEQLRELLVNAYKSAPSQLNVSVTRGAWDIRVR